MSSTPIHPAHTLLSRAHSPDTAHQLFTDRIKNRPLILRPTSPPPRSSSSSSNNNNRQRRRLERLRKREYFLRRRKPRPLSAREKRVSGVHDLGRDEEEGKGKAGKLSWAVYEGLNRLWRGYVWEVLGLEEKKKKMTTGTVREEAKEEEEEEEKKKKKGKAVVVVSAQNHGPLLASLDYHGAEVEVVRCGCVGRVGTKGIVVRDTKFTFVVVTRRDEVRSELSFANFDLSLYICWRKKCCWFPAK
jgi:ribonuclease P protein subunit POP4